MGESLERLFRRIRRCPRCERCKTRTLAVPGEGDQRAPILMLGEAPGKQEDKSGKPFVGRAGLYLEKVLSDHEVMRERLFITSILKCYHPDPPRKAQIEACRLWTQLQIEVLKPRLIFVIGRHAAWGLLRMSSLKAEQDTADWQGIPCFVTCHPAAAMRFPKLNRQFRMGFARLIHEVEKMGILKHIR